MDGWSRRLFYLGIAVILSLGLLLAPATTTPQASAAGADSEWKKFATPNMDNWFVAPGFNVYDYAVDAEDTVIYAVGDLWIDNNTNGTVGDGELHPKLLKSEDGGATWSDKTKAIEDYLGDDAQNFSYSRVAVAPDNPDFVAVSIWNTTAPPPPSGPERMILYSYDGGKKFKTTGSLVNITPNVYPIPLDISVSPLYGEDVRNIALIGANSIAGNIGVVQRHRFESERAVDQWVDATTTSKNVRVYNWSNCNVVTSIAWSPNFASDYAVLVVTYDNANRTRLQQGYWPWDGEEDIQWNDRANKNINRGGTNISADGTPGGVINWGIRLDWSFTTGIALPSDFDGDDRNSLRALVYVNNRTTNTSTIYTVDECDGGCSEVDTPIIKRGNPLLASLDYCGEIAEGRAVAGAFGNGKGMDIANLTSPCAGVEVYRCDAFSDMDNDKGKWSAAAEYKRPSGIGPAVVSYANDEGTKLYALTRGVPWWWYGPGNYDGFFQFNESALSVSFNDGESWNQVGLINTDIGYLTDVAAGADCNTTLVASINHTGGVDWWNGICSSLWLKCEALPEYASEYNGKWLRVWYGGINNFSVLRLAPEETTDVEHVYLSDWNTSRLFYTESKGLVEWNLDTQAPYGIVDFAMKEAGSGYVLSDDGRVSKFEVAGVRVSWPKDYKNVDTELKNGNTIAVLGDNVLVGGESADVSYSSDGGLTFTELADGLPEDGLVFVAFDSYFDTNKVVYAAVAGDDIYRWTIDESDEWQEMHATDALVDNITDELLAAQVSAVNITPFILYTGLVTESAGSPMTSATTGGVLYASYMWWNVNRTGIPDGNFGSGAVRCLNPAEEVCCGANDWDALAAADNIRRRLTNYEVFANWPTGLKICGCLSPDTNSKLFAIDVATPYYAQTLIEDMNIVVPGLYDPAQGRLWKFEDCFAKAAPVMTAPADGAVIDSDPCNCWNDAFTLKWDRQCDACNYTVEISLDADFTELVEPSSGSGGKWGPDKCVKPPQGATPSLVIPNGALGDGSCGTTYYWRVRACHAETGQDIRSPWSEARTFTIGAGPEARVKLTNPANGAVVPPANIQFTWDIVPDATGYVFSLKNPVAGTDVVAATNVAGTTYIYTGTLSYNAPYLWTVKAMKGDVVFGEATATFTTSSAPVAPEEPSTPAWVWVAVVLGTVVWLVILVLIFRTRRV